MAIWRAVLVLPWVLGLWMPAPVLAAELKIHYEALRKLLLEQAFTDNGRSYLTGGPRSRCNYAFLENPRVIAHGERLRIAAHFQGRTALEIGGSCVGPEEAFDVSLTGVPSYRDGMLYLDEVQLEPAEGLYADLIRVMLGDAFSQSLQYPLLDQARKLAEEASTRGGYEIRVPSLNVEAIHVAPEAVIFSFDFSMEVK